METVGSNRRRRDRRQRRRRQQPLFKFLTNVWSHEKLRTTKINQFDIRFTLSKLGYSLLSRPSGNSLFFLTKWG